MLDRQQAGEVADKHHVQLRGPDGALRWEHCLTRKGFDGAYSILYHLNRPQVQEVRGTPHGGPPVEVGVDRPLARRHYRTQDLSAGGAGVLEARRILLFNDDVAIGVGKPQGADPHYVSYADGDELVFVFAGSGVLRSAFGDLRYERFDYVCIPKGVVHRWIPDDGSDHWLVHMSCVGGVGLLPQWRNDVGQLRMDAPYSHRDFKRPEFKGPMDEGLRDLVVVRDGRSHRYLLRHSPLDAVGWDGTVYPWVFPMLRFQPRAGLVHLPPDWHGTFATRGALICSFVPRVVDFHPDAIPCPYPHSSVDCDEVLFYCDGNFTSRRGVGPGSLSHHPYGIPHGPHPGAYEASLGTRTTDETAVMLDTFKPLRPTAHALALEDAGYHDSFEA